MKINLKRLLKKKSIKEILNQFQGQGRSLYISDSRGEILFGEKRGEEEYPILLDNKIIGFSGGSKEAHLLSSFLTCLAEGEMEKKLLGQETLDKYKEINLLYETTEKITAILSQDEVAQLIVDEIMRIIKCDEILVFLLKEEELFSLSSWRRGEEPICLFNQGETLKNAINTGKAEIINQIPCTDMDSEGKGSLMCAPLKIKEKVLGVILVLTVGDYSFTAGDLKILSALAFQAASALENIRLFQDYLTEQRDRQKVTRLFGRYVAPQIAQEILEGGEENLGLGGIRREVTILFIDIRGFTSLAEGLSPEQVVEILNSFLHIVTQCIFENNGTIDKYAGDAAMAFYNAPLLLEEHPLWALKTAQAIRCHKKQLQKKIWKNTKKELEFGIGINTGEVVLGNIGTENRMEYTIIGNAVNVASRLEEMAGPGQVLVSETVYQQVDGKIPLQSIGPRNIRGLQRPIMVYELV